MTTPRDILQTNRLLAETEKIGTIRQWTTGPVQKRPDGTWKPLPQPKTGRRRMPPKKFVSKAGPKLPTPAPELEIFSATGYAKCALSGEKIRPGDAVCKLPTGKLAHLAYAKAPHTVKPVKPYTPPASKPNDPFEAPFEDD